MLLALLELCISAPLERDARAHAWQNGGGLYIAGTATLINSNVYANEAEVGACFEHSLNFHRPAGRLRVLLVGSLAGGSTSLHFWAR